MFGEGTTMTSRQIAVTYSHSKKWERVVPENQSSKFQGTISKLENKEPIKILFYGDSITTGSNSSGKVGTQPMAETYPQMIKSYLKKKYSYDDIQYTNTAVGGKNSDWAIENVQSLVI